MLGSRYSLLMLFWKLWVPLRRPEHGHGVAARQRSRSAPEPTPSSLPHVPARQKAEAYPDPQSIRMIKIMTSRVLFGSVGP